MVEPWTEDLGAHREGLDVTPGICDPRKQGRETLLEIVNNGPLPITIERGQVLAIGEALPPGLVLVRRGVNPETGEEPEVLYVTEAGEAKTMSLAEAECPELADLEKQATVQEPAHEESRFDTTQGLPMYQTDDQWLSWKHIERPGLGAGAAEHGSVLTASNAVGSKKAVSGELGPASSNDADSFQSLTTGDLTIGSAKAKAFDVCRHLMQNEDLISQIFESELPPEEYYDLLGPILQEQFRGCDPTLVEHVIALIGAFDTATAFAMSFGI